MKITSAAKKPLDYGTTLLKWRVPEYEQHKKGPLWRLGAIIAVMGFVLYGILSNSYAFSIVIALFAGVYFLLHQEPAEIEIRVTTLGIVAGKRFYEYDNIRMFWVLYKPGEVEVLNIFLKKNMVKEISLLLGDQDPAELREVLRRFVLESAEKEEGFVNWLTRKMKL